MRGIGCLSTTVLRPRTRRAGTPTSRRTISWWWTATATNRSCRDQHDPRDPVFLTPKRNHVGIIGPIAQCGQIVPRFVTGNGEPRSAPDSPHQSRPIELHQVFRAEENENIRLISVLVLGQSLVRFARDGGKRETPTKAEYSIARAGVVRKRKLQEAGAAGTGCDGHGHGASAGDWIRGKLFANAADGSPAFGNEMEGARNGALLASVCCFSLLWLGRSTMYPSANDSALTGS